MRVWPFSDPIGVETLRHRLRGVTVAYLCLPLLVFVVGWLRAPLAVCSVVAIGIVAVALVGVRGRSPAVDGGGMKVSLLSLVTGLVPVAALVAASGVGGFGIRNWDWAKHDAVLKDLICDPWPVRYATEAGTTGLVYYLAYYLPASVVGKIAGWTAANLATAAMSLLGAALAVLWLVVLVRVSPVVGGLFFVFFSGMDVLGAALLALPSPDFAGIFSKYHLENWSEYWQYSSNVSLLYFVPQQAIPGWLLVALLVDAAETERTDLPLAALAGVSLLWSPFVALGLLPLLVAFLLTRPGSVKAALRAQRSLANLAGAALAALFAAYFASRFLPLALPQRYHPEGTPASRGEFWLVPAQLPVGPFLVHYSLFVLCEFALLWLVVLRAQRRDQRTPHMLPLLRASGLVLLVLPFFHYGLFNDLVMRTSIPALFVLQIAALQVLRWGVRRAATVAIAGIVAVGALYSGNLLRMHVWWMARSGHVVALAPMRSVRSLFEMQLYDSAAMKREFVSQYLGAGDSFFFQYLGRRSTPSTVDVADPLAATARKH